MPETKKIPIILDGDPGHDDAIAWVFAHGCGLFDILAVTSVGGNQTIQKTTYNSLRVCTLIGLNAPVARGCYHPLNTEQMNAPTVHGESGLDGPALPEPAFEVEPGSGIELWARVIRECPEKVTIVSTGPLTNTAAFLLAHPELKDRIERISLMGGGCLFGNWTPAAEFNILVDPEAAKIVFESGLPIPEQPRQRHRLAVAGVLLSIPQDPRLRGRPHARSLCGDGPGPSGNFHHP